MFCSRWCVLSYFAILEGSNTHFKKKEALNEEMERESSWVVSLISRSFTNEFIINTRPWFRFLSFCSSPTIMFWCGYTHTYRSLTIAAKGTNNQRHTHVLTFIILFMSVKRFGKYMLFFSLASVRFLSLTSRSISNFSFGQATVDESNE